MKKNTNVYEKNTSPLEMHDQINISVEILFNEAYEYQDEIIIKYSLGLIKDVDLIEKLQNLEINNFFFTERITAAKGVIKERKIKSYNEYKEAAKYLTDKILLDENFSNQNTTPIKKEKNKHFRKAEIENVNLSSSKANSDVNQEAQKSKYELLDFGKDRTENSFLYSYREQKLMHKLFYCKNVENRIYLLIEISKGVVAYFLHQIYLSVKNFEDSWTLFETSFSELMHSKSSYCEMYDPVYFLKHKINNRLLEINKIKWDDDRKIPDFLLAFDDYYKKGLFKKHNSLNCNIPSSSIIVSSNAMTTKFVFANMNPIIREFGEALCLIAGERFKTPFAIRYMILVDNFSEKDVAAFFNLSHHENIASSSITVIQIAIKRHWIDILGHLSKRKIKSKVERFSLPITNNNKHSFNQISFELLIRWLYSEIEEKHLDNIYSILSKINTDEIIDIFKTMEGIICVQKSHKLLNAKSHSNTCNTFFKRKYTNLSSTLKNGAVYS